METCIVSKSTIDILIVIKLQQEKFYHQFEIIIPEIIIQKTKKLIFLTQTNIIIVVGIGIILSDTLKKQPNLYISKSYQLKVCNDAVYKK